jgi:hypothetical protein
VTTRVATHEMRHPRPLAEEAFVTLDGLLAEAHEREPVDTLCAICDAAMAAAAFGSASEMEHDRILRAFRIEAQAGAALFDLALRPGETCTYRLGERIVSLRSLVAHEYTLPLDWCNAYASSCIVRDTSSTRRLATVPADVLRRSTSVMDVDAYNFTLVEGLRALELCDPRARDLLSRACEAAGSEHAQVSPEWAHYLGQPLATLALCIVDREVDAIHDALVWALEQHRAFWGKTDRPTRRPRSEDPFGVIARWPLGLACLAYDRGIPIDVESSYIPGWIIRRER